MLAAVRAVEKSYGDQTVLDGVTLELREGARLALIGRNGTGKTTVLRLLAGVEEPDAGAVERAAGVVVGVLDQAPEFAADDTVGSVASAAFAELDELEGRLAELERRGLDDPIVYEAWERAHETFERRGGYARRSRRDAVLHALGFAGRADEPAERLSGGERTRLGLGRLLMAQPDVALLDEPTNHLDLEMRAWLGSFLARYPGAVVVVSHDRAFLDEACDRTAELEAGRLRTFDGTPSAYREADAARRAREAATHSLQVREHARLEEAAERMMRWAGQNEKLARRAKAIQRRAERYEAEMIEVDGPPQRTTRFVFPAGPSGEVVLAVRHLSARYEGPLFDDVALTVRRGERIAIVGPNGAGKTTFLRVLLGERPSDDPRAAISWGARVKVAYYDQSLSGFDPEATLVETLLRLVGDRRAHDLLGRFLFPYDAQFKRVGDLSGGERARLALLELTLQEANVLVLDEPTNHLDLEMIEALEDALLAFEGTLLMVSHDRRLLERLAGRVWELDGGRFEDYEGDWGFYQRTRARRRGTAGAAASAGGAASTGAASVGGSVDAGGGAGPAADAGGGARGAAPDGDPRSTWQLERDLEEAEREVERLTARLDAARRAVEAVSLDPDADHVAVAEAGERFVRDEASLIEAMRRWEGVDELLRRRRGG